MEKRLMPSMMALQCFEAVARHMSVTRAAEELHMTQSAISKQIAQLEALLRNPLFLRVRRRLQLTPAGALYQSEVRTILNQVDMSSRYILTYGSETQVLTIGTQPTFGSRWLIPRLQRFMAAHPDIQVKVRSETRPFDLMQAKIDISFFFGHGTLPGAQCLELFEADVVPVCAPGFLRGGRIASLDELSQQTLIQCASRPEAWHDYFSHQQYQSDSSYHGPRFDTFYMCVRAAEGGCGIALTPRLLAEEELQAGKLVIPWGYVQPSDGAYFVAYSEHSAEVPKIKQFVGWVRDEARQQEARGGTRGQSMKKRTD
ncbi:MAG: LysR substrate-binding domain-containing protein [Achromobacter mucicolens]|uniref:LysR substrate-binding domain-containing protein n=1 Tax=Achromobacter TaxID=222 RepID=UPI001D025113|nr:MULTISPECIES: LysR substrate-binding domain-containing protein [Achromobacter]MCU6614943.1 LysR substrate-binding domain-containing protein [Achromobacter mucicolens]UDG76747.1 LysR family transcriptional regulator [Achromobacter sp. 77]